MEIPVNMNGRKCSILLKCRVQTNKVLLVLFTTFNIVCVNAQLKTDTNMIEKFNYEATKGGTKDTSFLKDDWLIDIRATSIIRKQRRNKNKYKISTS